MAIKLGTWMQHLAVSGLVLAAGPALAQEELGGAPPEVAPEPDPSEALGRPSGEAAPAAPAPAQTEGKELQTHTVVRGDTLWDLSGKYLNNSWYWPKVWSYNPQIANPHWIYPGNQIRFSPGDADLPTNVDVSRTLETDEEEPAEDVRTLGALELGSSAKAVWRAHNYFVSKEEQADAGQIVNAENEMIMQSQYDRVYIEQESPGQVGDHYAIYRTQEELVHPETGEEVGYAVDLIGGVTIDGHEGDFTTATISESYRPVQRGDFIGPWPSAVNAKVDPAPNTVTADGWVIATAGDSMILVGEYYTVYVDLGTRDGVKPGNVLEVLRQRDGYTEESDGLPTEQIGQLMILSAGEKASTALVTRSLTELHVGDRVHMTAR